MKPRKQGETDAEYIARLEHSAAQTKANYDRLKKDHNRLYEFIVPAAQKAGQVLDCAAEITGMTGDEQVAATKAGLNALGSCIWNDDSVEVPPLPKMAEPKAEFAGDAEMILKSALERVKQQRAPWESWTDLVPELFDGIDPASLHWEEMAGEVYDALADLEISRGLLRLDLRSTMYDHCFGRIRHVLMHAEHRACTERLEVNGAGDEAEMPF